MNTTSFSANCSTRPGPLTNSRPRHAPGLLLACLWACSPLGSIVNAQYYSDVQSIADKTVAQREAATVQARRTMRDAAKALENKDYEQAWRLYQQAYEMTPESMAAGRTYREALAKYGEVSVLFAEQRVVEGRRQDAENILKIYLKADPEYRPALNLLRRLEEPAYYNPTVTPGFVDRVEQVKQLIGEAKGFYDTGRYDLAYKRYEQVLNLDKYNIAARRGIEEVIAQKNRYAETAYDSTRAELLWEVERRWELPVRKFDKLREGEQYAIERQPEGVERIKRKLATIILPRITFNNVSVKEAIDFLQSQSIKLDPDTNNPGINIVLKAEAAPPLPAPGAAPLIPGLEPAPGAAPAAGALTDPAQSRVTLNLTNAPLGDALKYVTELANLKYKVEPSAVLVVPMGTVVDTMMTKRYRVPPGFIETSAAGDAGAATANSPFGGGAAGGGGGDAAGTGGAFVMRQTAQQSLEKKGVVFPPGSSAIYLPQGSSLVVRNTQENLDFIEALIEQGGSEVPTQVEIESKFLEITQTNLKELGFDWLLGPFNVGNERVFGSGGTVGTGTAVDSSNYSFSSSDGSAVGTNPITAGNRSGSYAIKGNAIDALIAGTSGATSSVAPGILSLAGVFTDPQFQVTIRALNQQTGVDLMSAPRVTTKSGQRAVIEIIREFRYPTEFEPPEIPQDFGNSSSSSVVGTTTQSNVFPVTPTTPTAFETRNTGVTLEVEPQVGADGYTIDLNLVPTVTEFEGFINYGSPIQTVSVNALGVASTNVLTPNVINQPIFSTRRITTSVSIWDGHTVVLGGLMREDVQRTQDKVPGIGDLPLVGRLFRTEADQHVKRNLVIFVTARLLDPAGQPIQKLDEEEGDVETLIGPDIPRTGLPAGFAK